MGFDRHAYKMGAQKAEALAEESNMGRIAAALERIATQMEKQDNELGSTIYNSVKDAMFQEWVEGRGGR